MKIIIMGGGGVHVAWEQPSSKNVDLVANQSFDHQAHKFNTQIFEIFKGVKELPA